MQKTRINKEQLLASLPDEWPEDLLPKIQQQVNASRRKVVVLDDDPTGTQTIHTTHVLTEWSVARLRNELANDLPAFYLLTNSRSLTSPAAEAMNREIGANLVEAARQAKRDFAVVSRSDSTLRGHFPREVEALAGALGQDFDAWLIIPFFLEGGRYTINDVHYVAEGEWLVPAGETEFARDAAFGYRASDLRQWVQEKMGGRMLAGNVDSISIEDIRLGGPGRVAEQLAKLRPGGVCVVNAASYRDMEVFVGGLLSAEAHGQRFLYRTAASFVRVRAGLAPRPLLTRADFHLAESAGGLVVVGSYVPRTTSQVDNLLLHAGMVCLEISVKALLDENQRTAEIQRLARQADHAMRGGQAVMLYTSRELITGDDAESSLFIGRQVSEGLVTLVQAISVRPRYLLAKGGITSSDVATRGLNVKRALVLGQILPGVPVWQLGPESRHPGLDYIVFPGNVGDARSLVKIAEMLQK
jgi:uncharacterized protein YgbK (DUF1537 family)